jgi:hypothetical protein
MQQQTAHIAEHTSMSDAAYNMQGSRRYRYHPWLHSCAQWATTSCELVGVLTCDNFTRDTLAGYRGSTLPICLS